MSDKSAPPPPTTSVKMWMPLYIGDYLADTIGLSLSQHGAYFMAMCAYWSKGESLSSEELQSVTSKEFDRVSKFFILVDNRWHHKRIDIELAKARTISAVRKASAEKAVAARRALGQLQPLPPKEPNG